MAVAVPVLLAIGTAVAAYGAYQQGAAARSAGHFNEAVQRQNAEMAAAQTRTALAQQQRNTILRLGAVRAAAGAGGGATDEGSVLDVLGDVAAQSELEKQQIAYRGEAAKRGYLNTAALDSFSADTASQAGMLRAGSELLGGSARTAYYGSGLNRT